MWWLTTKSEHITLDLSGTRFSYDSPLDYSKRYPRRPADTQTQYRINIHDQDLYKKQNRSATYIHGIRQSFWDYGRSLIWSDVKGTLSMTVALYRTPQYEFDSKDHDAFIKTLQADFDLTYKRKHGENFTITAPENYHVKTISSTSWVCYEFAINSSRRVAYAYPLSDHHYFSVEFDFASHSESQKDKWEQQAQATMDFIMASFEVK